MKYSDVIEYKRKKRQQIQDRNRDYYQRIRDSFSDKNKIRKENVFHKESGKYIGFVLGRKSGYIYVCMRDGKKIRCPDNIFNNLYEIHK